MVFCGDKSLKINVFQSEIGFINLSTKDTCLHNNDLEFNISINASLNYSIIIPNEDNWITSSNKGGNAGKTTIKFSLSPLLNNNSERNGKIIFKANDVNFVSETLYVSQSSPDIFLRKALESFYKSTNGDNWNINTNWLSNKPLDEWHGVKSYSDGSLYLMLANNNLSGSLPNDIGNIEFLENLFLEGNKLSGEIPESFYRLKNLKKLDLSGNNLRGSFNGIKNCKKLESLIMFPNPGISLSLVSLLELDNLERVALNYVNINESIPEGINKLKKLKALTLSDCKLTGELPSSLFFMDNLEYLFLNNNNLSGKLPNSFANLTKLEVLFLNNNNFSGQVPVSMGFMKNLRALSLYLNNFTGCIPQTIQHLPNWGNSISEFSVCRQKDGTDLSLDKYTVGDLIYEKKSNTNEYAPVAVVYTLTDNNYQKLSEQDLASSYALAISLEENKLKWSTEFSNTGAISRESGKNNYNSLINYLNRASKDISTYPAFEWCLSFNERYQANNKAESKWFLPAPKEIRDIVPSIGKVNTTIKHLSTYNAALRPIENSLTSSCEYIVNNANDNSAESVLIRMAIRVSFNSTSLDVDQEAVKNIEHNVRAIKYCSPR